MTPDCASGFLGGEGSTWIQGGAWVLPGQSAQPIFTGTPWNQKIGASFFFRN